jgi:hypothetical protein
MRKGNTKEEDRLKMRKGERRGSGELGIEEKR